MKSNSTIRDKSSTENIMKYLKALGWRFVITDHDQSYFHKAERKEDGFWVRGRTSFEVAIMAYRVSEKSPIVFNPSWGPCNMCDGDGFQEHSFDKCVTCRGLGRVWQGSVRKNDDLELFLKSLSTAHI